MNKLPMTILSVDDEPTAQLMIRQIFRKEIASGEYVLVFAESGVEALARLSEGPVGVVLSDINMPKMDGLELIKQIYYRYPGLRVIMVSAYTDLSHIRGTMNYGAFDYLPKPINPNELRDLVRLALTMPHPTINANPV